MFYKYTAVWVGAAAPGRDSGVFRSVVSELLVATLHRLCDVERNSS